MKKEIGIFIFYSLDRAKLRSNGASEGDPDTETYASPGGPNPKYAAEFIESELREEGRVQVKAFYQVGDIDEILDHQVIVIGSVSNGGEISPSTLSLFDEILDPSYPERREKLMGKLVSCFVTSDTYESCARGRDTIMGYFEDLQVRTVPGLIITESMGFADAAQNIRSFCTKIKEALKSKKIALAGPILHLFK